MRDRQPGGVYGPGDHSELGNLTKQTLAGKLPLIPFPDFGIVLVHVEDVAAGDLAALDRGRDRRAVRPRGRGDHERELIQTIAEIGGRKPPSSALPTGADQVDRPLGPWSAP